MIPAATWRRHIAGLHYAAVGAQQRAAAAAAAATDRDGQRRAKHAHEDAERNYRVYRLALTHPARPNDG